MPKQLELIESAYNQYKIIEKIGEGGSGEVYKVIDEDNNELALKVLSSEKMTTEKRKRFKNEINFAQKINIPI